MGRERTSAPGKGSIRDTSDELEHVALDNPNVAKAPRLDGFENCSDSGRVNVDTDDVLVGAKLGDFDQRFAAAESDVEDHVDARIEQVVERQRRALDAKSPSLHRPLIRNDSRRRKPAAARLERPLWRVVAATADRHGTMMVTAATCKADGMAWLRH